MNIYIIQVNAGKGCITMLLVLICGVDLNQFIELKECEFNNNKREENIPKVSKSEVNRRIPRIGYRESSLPELKSRGQLPTR
jgi:hypothetical protein